MIPIPASWMEGEEEEGSLSSTSPSSIDPWLNLLQQSLRQSFMEDEDEHGMEEENEKVEEENEKMIEWDRDDVLHYAAPKQHFSMPPSNSNKKGNKDNHGSSSTGNTGSKLEHMLENIYEAMNVARGHAKHVKLQELNLDTVLSAMPYRAMMQSCFGHEHIMQQGKKKEEASAKWLADIPNVTRSFEEKFMREPMPNSNERQCAQVKPFFYSFLFSFITFLSFPSLKECNAGSAMRMPLHRPHETLHCHGIPDFGGAVQSSSASSALRGVQQKADTVSVL